MSEKNYEKLAELIGGGERGVIVIHPDPDSLASAWGLRLIFQRLGSKAEVALFDPIKRLENRSMVRALGIPVVPFKAALLDGAMACLVDAQPGQFPQLEPGRWSIVIDHHPAGSDYEADFADVRPELGATSTILLEYLEAAGVKVSKRLATALCYGILTDTDHFQRRVTRADAEAFSRLFPRADYQVLHIIEQAEVPKSQLHFFDLAFHRMKIDNRRAVIHIGAADSADIAVILADFLLRVSGIEFVVISIFVGPKLVLVFRNRGAKKHAGKVAAAHFLDYGPAGGHHAAARAELPLDRLPREVEVFNPDSIETFIEKRLSQPGKPAGPENNFFDEG